jgi:hypothetical protein
MNHTIAIVAHTKRIHHADNLADHTGGSYQHR